MIDPPITLQNQENLPRLTYIQDVIHPLQNSETKFPPVNGHDIKNGFVFIVFRNSMNTVLHYGLIQVFKPVIGDLMNTN